MNIIVCLKQVPDTETRITLRAGEKAVDEGSINWILNPYDEFAVEEALRIRERLGSGTVTLVTMGPGRAEQALRTGLAMGADEAVHLKDEAFEGSDPGVVAKVLAAAIGGMAYDLILCGKQAIDDDSAQVGPRLAELLGLPQVTFITRLELAADLKSAVAYREVEGATEVVEVTLPAVLTASKGLNEPRYPSLMGIKKAARKEIRVLDLATLGLAAGEVGRAGSATVVVDIFLPPPRQGGRLVEGDTPAEKARALVKLLHEEARIV